LPTLKLYSPQGCEACREGYHGRTGIYEVLPMTNKIAQLILAGGSSLDVTAAAHQAGMSTLRESGLAKAKLGITSLAEVNRVTKD
jgi:type IV pilus assembly protein PilB